MNTYMSPSPTSPSKSIKFNVLDIVAFVGAFMVAVSIGSFLGFLAFMGFFLLVFSLLKRIGPLRSW